MANSPFSSLSPIVLNGGNLAAAYESTSIVAGNNNNLKYIQQIGDQFYHIEIWIYNQIDGYKPHLIPFLFVEAMVIEETLVNWPTNGWIILKNNLEMFERGSLSLKSGVNGEPDRPQISAPYIFRNDGRNRISIKIYPINNPTNIGNDVVQSELPKNLWEMSYDFVIYDIEDLPTDNTQNKSRKLYFQDERLQILKERNIQWSTAQYGPNQGKKNVTDKEKAMNATEAIKSIIKAAGSKTSDPNNSDLKIGYKEGESIDKPSIPLASFGQWDNGIGPNGITSDIIYTSPAYSCALDDLNYAYQNCISSDGTPLILDFGRNTEDKKFHLQPLSYYFQNAEKNQIEKLILEDGLDSELTPPYVPRAPNMPGTYIQNFTSGIASRIKKYKFAPMVSSDDMRITNRPLHNFDFSKSEFSIYQEDNTAAKVAENIENLAKQGLYAYNNKGQILMNVNQTKQTGLMTTPSFEPQVFFPKNKPALKMMKEVIFLSQSLYFQSPGLTFRTPGKFIFVDRITSSENNPFDDRFLGQWLIVKTMHIFTQDTYLNDVVATKVDAFKKMFPILDSKL
jgi:hypothetical protein